MRINPRIASIGSAVILLAFLAAGVTFRVTRGPLKNGSELLGFVPEGPPGPEPVCIDRGEVPAGATLSEVLAHEGLSPEDASQFIEKLASMIDVRHIRPQDEYRLLTDKTGFVTRFEFQPTEAGYFVVSRDSTGFKAWREQQASEKRYRRVEGEVQGSLYASLVRQGLPAQLVATFCDIFSYDVDFTTETQDGDRFEMLVEEEALDGARIGAGRILAGRYVNGETPYDAFYYESKGKGQYYKASGLALRRAFLKSPLNYTRVSSLFSTHRLHPIFRTVRPHMGVDLAAPMGTPVVSVADGTVTSAGWVNGYGNLLRVRHNNGISTYYAHLSRFGRGIRAGTHVDQNEVIGFVGMTGNATGPHLDYRIEQAGRFVNPLAFKVTAGDPLAASDRPSFDDRVDGYRSVLTALDSTRALPEARFAELMSQARTRTSAMAQRTGEGTR